MGEKITKRLRQRFESAETFRRGFPGKKPIMPFIRKAPPRSFDGGGGGDAVEGLPAPDPVNEMREIFYKSDEDAPLSNIDERLGRVEKFLRQVTESKYKNASPVVEMANKILSDAKVALVAINNDDEDKLKTISNLEEITEVVVHGDGSRPSFFTDNNTPLVDADSPWSDVITNLNGPLNSLIAAIGRINLGVSHIGTGFLVANNLIATNHHVLESITVVDVSTGGRKIRTGAKIGFGFERGKPEGRTYQLKSVAFSAGYLFNSAINHNYADIALIEVDNANDPDFPNPIPIFDANDWAAPNDAVLLIGYPAEPPEGSGLSSSQILNTFLHEEFGLKRVAPGRVMDEIPPKPWSMCHDASTLGGNSGSPVVVAYNPGHAAGLHYGGSKSTPIRNYAHIMAETLAVIDKKSRKTLKEIFDQYGVNLETI